MGGFLTTANAMAEHTTFEKISGLPNDHNLKDFIYNNNGNIVLSFEQLAGGEENGLWRSQDGGIHWSKVPSMANNGFWTAQFYPDDSKKVLSFQFIHPGNIFFSVSDDGGQTWKRLDKSSCFYENNNIKRAPTYIFPVSAKNHKVLFASENHVYLSDDDGLSCKTVDLPKTDSDWVVTAPKNNQWFVGANSKGKIIYSPDQGKTWKPSTIHWPAGISPNKVGFIDVTYSSNKPDTAFATGFLDQSFVLTSTDRGKTWLPMALPKLKYYNIVQSRNGQTTFFSNSFLQSEGKGLWAFTGTFGNSAAQPLSINKLCSSNKDCQSISVGIKAFSTVSNQGIIKVNIKKNNDKYWHIKPDNYYHMTVSS